MKCIGMFFCSVALAACSHATTAKNPAVLKVQEFPVLPAPPLEILDNLVEAVITLTITASAADLAQVEIIMGLLNRADHSEIMAVIEEDRSFEIQEIHLGLFWHAAIDMANVFLLHPECAERERFLEGEGPPNGFYEYWLKNIPPVLQPFCRAAARYLVTKARTAAYRCR